MPLETTTTSNNREWMKNILIMDKTDTERYIQRGFNMVNFHHQFHHHHDRMEQIEKVNGESKIAKFDI